MHETEYDVQDLQDLIDTSIDSAGEFLKKSFQMPDCSLTAEQIIRFLQGMQTVSLATVTANYEPRVAPIGALFYRGRYYIPTVESAARCKMLSSNPTVSLTQYDGIDLAIIIHGQATILRHNHAYYTDIEKTYRDLSRTNINEWGKGGEGVFIRIEPRVLYTYARHGDSV